MAIKRSSNDNYLFVLNAFLVVGLIAAAAFLREDATEIRPITPVSQTAVNAAANNASAQESASSANVPITPSAPTPAPTTTLAPTPATPPPTIVQRRENDD